MNNLWSISIEDYLAIIEKAIVLGKERGKKQGDKWNNPTPTNRSR